MRQLRAGSACVDITPAEPVPLGGYPTTIRSPAFNDGPRPARSTGVADPIGVRALVLADGERTVAVVASDLLNVYREFSEAVRREVSDLPVDEMVLTATHTHSAPYMPGLLLEVNPFLTVETDVSPVVEDIRAAFVESIRAAHRDLAPATLRVGRAAAEGTAVNRRVEGGPVDPELLVLCVERAGADPAVLVNFACHPICLTANDAVVSADFPGVVYERVEAALDGATTLYVNGAAGDVNPRDVYSRYEDGSSDRAYMTEIGEEVADAALRAVEDARDGQAREAPELAAERRDLDLRLREVADREALEARSSELAAEIERLEAAADDEAAFERRWDRLYLRERLNVDALDRETVPATVQYLSVGEAGLVSLPGEPFVRHGLDLKERASADALVVAGYANEYVGYLPTPDALQDGGYEVLTSKVDATGVERVREAALGLVERA